MRGLEFLNLRIRVPLLAVNFVAPDMEVCVGEKLGHFFDELVEELVGGLARWIDDRIAAFERERSGAAGEIGISDDPRTAVTGHVELRNHANAALMCVGDEVANLRLRVIESAGTVFLQLWELLALDAESLIVGKMPVQDVHLHRGHAVDISSEHIERNEVTADSQSAGRAIENAAGL